MQSQVILLVILDYEFSCGLVQLGALSVVADVIDIKQLMQIYAVWCGSLHECTGRTLNPQTARSWGFKSPSGHHR